MNPQLATGSLRVSKKKTHEGSFFGERHATPFTSPFL
jgi:hypothetical protein